jgi:MFS family permease
MVTRDFRLLASGQALSWLGTGFQTVALSVAVITTGGGPGGLGAVQASSVLALLVATLFGGVWADRVEPRTVMVWADLSRCAAVSGMAVVFAAGGRSIAVLCLLAALTAGAGAFFNPAMSALKPTLVVVEKRRSANATLSLLQTGASVLGPATGGVLVAAAGPATGFAVNAASFLVSAGSVLAMRARAPVRPPRDSLLRDLGAGWREICRHDWLRVGILAATVYHVANGVLLVVTQVVVIRDLGGAHAVGLVAAAEGLGGAGGAFIAMRTHPTRPLRAGWTALLLMPVWAASYVWPGTLGAVLLGAILGYAGLLYFDVGWETAIQDHVPHRLLARVASWDTLASFIAMPVGSALAGPLSAWLGMRPVLAGCALGLAGSSLAPLATAGTRHLANTKPQPPLDAATVSHGP